MQYLEIIRNIILLVPVLIFFILITLLILGTKIRKKSKSLIVSGAKYDIFEGNPFKNGRQEIQIESVKNDYVSYIIYKYDATNKLIDTTTSSMHIDDMIKFFIQKNII